MSRVTLRCGDGKRKERGRREERREGKQRLEIRSPNFTFLYLEER
jgi:hypothetical protein